LSRPLMSEVANSRGLVGRTTVWGFNPSTVNAGDSGMLRSRLATSTEVVLNSVRMSPRMLAGTKVCGPAAVGGPAATAFLLAGSLRFPPTSDEERLAVSAAGSAG